MEEAEWRVECFVRREQVAKCKGSGWDLSAEWGAGFAVCGALDEDMVNGFSAGHDTL